MGILTGQGLTQSDLAAIVGVGLPQPTGVDATDTANVQAAIDAMYAAGGGTVVVPPGVYVAHGLVPKSGVIMRGAGPNVSKLRTTTSGGDLFVSPTGTNALVFEALSLQSVGGGNVFSGGLSQSAFRDCGFYQDVNGKCVFDVTQWIDVLVSNCAFSHTLAATVPTFRAMSSVADISSFTFDSCRFNNTGNYAIWLEGTLGAFCHNPTIRNITFENPVGGAINLLSTKNARVDTCGVHDLSTATTKTLLNIAKSSTAGGVDPRSTTITGWTRDSSATGLGSGLYDINNAAYDTTIIGANRYPNGTLAIQLNLVPAVVIGGEAALTQGDYAIRINGSCLRPGATSTAGRPAASVGVGSMYYDTTIGKPIWSNGSVWKDAAGTTV